MSDLTEFPKLMWLPDGREITVRSQDEQDLKLSEGCFLDAARTHVTVAATGVEATANEEEIVTDDESETPKRRGKK